jgi:hypothetical protein
MALFPHFAVRYTDPRASAKTILPCAFRDGREDGDALLHGFLGLRERPEHTTQRFARCPVSPCALHANIIENSVMSWLLLCAMSGERMPR